MDCINTLWYCAVSLGRGRTSTPYCTCSLEGADQQAVDVGKKIVTHILTEAAPEPMPKPKRINKIATQRSLDKSPSPSTDTQVVRDSAELGGGVSKEKKGKTIFF